MCPILPLILYMFQYIHHHSVEANSCDNWDNHIACQLHQTPIDLNEYRENITDQAIHLIPDVAMVKRCGGNCHRPSHRCVPKKKEIKSIPVMAILQHFSHGNILLLLRALLWSCINGVMNVKCLRKPTLRYFILYYLLEP